MGLPAGSSTETMTWPGRSAGCTEICDGRPGVSSSTCCSGAGAGGEHQADQHDVEPREQWFMHVDSPSGYRASAQQCQAQPGKIGDQREDREQKADEGQAGRIELEHRPLEAQTGDEEVDAQRRQ